MKTLNKKITAGFFDKETGYDDLIERWSSIMQDRELRKQLTCSHHLLYLMLRGKDWRKALTRPTNKTKIENGADIGWIGGKALSSVAHALPHEPLLDPFRGLLSDSCLPMLHLHLLDYKWSDDIMEMEPYRDAE